MKPEVLSFISRFAEHPGTIDLFTGGCCFWFAEILCLRFHAEQAELHYDPIWNHFVARIGGRLYDATGDVTDRYGTIAWREFENGDDKDPHRKRVIDQCIMFKTEGAV